MATPEERVSFEEAYGLPTTEIGATQTVGDLMRASTEHAEDISKRIRRSGHILSGVLLGDPNDEEAKQTILEFCKKYGAHPRDLEFIYNIRITMVPEDFQVTSPTLEEQEEKITRETRARVEARILPPRSQKGLDAAAAAIEAMRLKRGTALGNPSMGWEEIWKRRGEYAAMLGLSKDASWAAIANHERESGQ